MPSGLLDRLQRILPFADQVADEIVYEKTDILEKTISRMFEVMYRVAEFSCDYVKNSGWSSHPSAFASADGRSENEGRVDLFGDDRRHGQRVDEGYRRLHACSGCRDSAAGQKERYALIVLISR
jgi:hypothetical protein